MYKNFKLTESEKEQILNMHKSHGYGQPLNEQNQPFLPATELIRKGYKGPGTDTASLVKGFQLIKSAADYKTVEGQLIQYGGYKSLIDVLNGELGSSDNVPAQQIQAALKAAGVDLQYKNMVNVNGGKFVQDFKLGAAPAAPAATAQATNGWWDKYPGLVGWMKGYKMHYPPSNMAQNGAIAAEINDGKAWDFFPDGRWYQYKTVDEGLKAITKAEYEGKWKDKNGVLVVSANDGTSYNGNTKTWTKPIPWVKQSGKFPLKYLEYGSTIKPLQTALKLKADGYFYNLVEKAVLAKAPEYKRETGVTQEIYDKIVPNVAVGKDLKTTYDMNTQAGKDAYLQQGLKNTTIINPAAKYSQITPQQQANADALKSGQPLNEQSPQLTQQDYKEIANYFEELMSGVNLTSDASNNILTTIYNRINNKQEWEGVKRAFGVRDGQNLEQWLNNEFNIDYNEIMKAVNSKEGEFKKQDSMYNPGTVIPLITNRQFTVGRSYNYASTMGDKVELNIDIKDAKVIRRDKDGIVIKATSIWYYDVDSYKRGESPKPKNLSNVCVKIPFSEIIVYRDETLQLSWFADWVKSRIVPCV